MQIMAAFANGENEGKIYVFKSIQSSCCWEKSELDGKIYPSVLPLNTCKSRHYSLNLRTLTHGFVTFPRTFFRRLSTDENRFSDSLVLSLIRSLAQSQAPKQRRMKNFVGSISILKTTAKWNAKKAQKSLFSIDYYQSLNILAMPTNEYLLKIDPRATNLKSSINLRISHSVVNQLFTSVFYIFLSHSINFVCFLCFLCCW